MKLLALITALICSFGALAAAGCNAGGGSDDNFVGLYDEVVKEEVKTKLPHTYDNNTILIIFAIVVVAIVAVSIRIAVLKKKEMSK